MLQIIENVNGVVNEYAWLIGLILLMVVGILMTATTKVFQVSHIGHWMKSTFGSLFKKNKSKDGKAISQFQALCTALAATVGTGNIVGVAAAIMAGGPGAIFWMWFAAFLGMALKFSEIVLGIYFRKRNANGEWSGGPMYFLKNGLGKIKGFGGIANVLAILFAVFAILASFGIGNMSQVDSITETVSTAFFKNVDLGSIAGIPTVNFIIGGALVVIVGLIVVGGLKRVAAVAELVVPFMAIFYVIGSLIILAMNITQLPAVFGSIFTFAFSAKAATGGIIGLITKAVLNGCKRGVFSNEAGMGSAVMAHTSANVKEPVKQGMWGIFEVFMDTFVICSMSALVMLSSGLVDLKTGAVAAEIAGKAQLATGAFASAFGSFGEMFLAVAMFFFAFTTVLGWSQYGAKAVEYLFGIKASNVYKVIFTLLTISGALLTSSLAWDISDTFNALMMIPNLIGVVVLFPLVAKITKNYVNRKLKGKDEKPMLSYDPDIQAEFEATINED
ncbi:MAG: alanine:cation symporter family protein [Clostridia bacterium]|nr:alanine:cation symporter family protein [Clostridia bacterium]